MDKNNQMTLNEAKKILGKSSKNITDVQIKKEIETAEFLANLFLDIYSKKKLNYSELKRRL